MYGPSTQESAAGSSTAASSSYPDPEDMQQHGRAHMPQSTSSRSPQGHGDQTQYGQYSQVPRLASELVLADGSRINPYFHPDDSAAEEESQQSFQVYPSVSNQAIAAGPPLQQSNLVLPDSGLYRERTDSSVTDPDSVLGESGRWYHGYKAGKYFLPNDPEEQDRLDFQHTALRLALDGRLTLAPLGKTPEYVLDVATGTGIWAIEFAKENPTSQVIGTDLSAIQPVDYAPPNCTFLKEDSEEEWLFRKQPPPGARPEDVDDLRIYFDFVHLRMVVTCFSDPKRVMRHAFENLKPGGWVEYQDGGFIAYQTNPLYPGDALQRAYEAARRGAASMGRDVMAARNYKKWLQEIGFVDVEERVFMMPINPWPDHPQLRLVGSYWLRNLMDGFRGVGYKMFRAAGLSEEDIENLVQEGKRELPHRKNHSYIPYYVVYGRKPLDGEEVASQERADQ